MKCDLRNSITCALPVIFAVLLSSSQGLYASCCGGGGALGGVQPEPANRMMGPLNKPLELTVVNDSNVVQPVPYGGSAVLVPPGTHPVSYGGTGETFAPQPGEENAFTPTIQAGIQEQTCPPKPVSSGAPAQSTNSEAKQKHGTPSLVSNLDKTGTPRLGEVFATDNVSPSPMDRAGGTGGTLTPPAVNYSASLGETFDPASGRSGLAGTLLPDGAALFDPADKSRYVLRGVQFTATDSTNGDVRTISITGSGMVEPTTTTLTTSTTQAANVLSIRFYKHDPSSGQPLPAPMKTTEIVRQSTAPDTTNGYTKGYTFTVTYPDGETNATQVWTSDPQTTTTLAKTKVISGIESKEWVSNLSGSQRTVTFSRIINGVLDRKTIDTYSLAPWANGREILTQSTVVVDGGVGDQITTYTYWNTPWNLNHTRLQRITYPDGSWAISALDVNGLKTITLHPYGSAPPATVSQSPTAPYNELVAVASGQNGFVYTAEYTTQSAPTMGIGSVSGQWLSYERYIGNVLAEKRVRAAGTTDIIEEWNGTDKRYKKDAIWKSENSSSGKTSLTTMTGRLNQFPLDSDFLDRSVTIQEPVGGGGIRFFSTRRQTDSQSTEIMLEQSWRSQVDGRPVLTKKYLNDVLIEVTEWLYELTGARRPLARKVNGVEVEAWAYPSVLVHPNAVRAETHAQGGTITVTEYDAVGRSIRQVLSGASAATVYGASVAQQAAIVTTWAYSGLASGNAFLPGYTVTESVQPEGQVARLTTSRYDGAGRLVSQQTPDGRARSWVYFSDVGFMSTESVYAGTVPTGSALTVTT
jgi:YD repeat-containing protein